MFDVADFGSVEAGVRAAAARPASALAGERLGLGVFKLLHGAYGSLFLSKFSTGELYESGPHKGKDKGVRVAAVVWGEALSKWPRDVVFDAVNRAVAESADFPPNLPVVERHCQALIPAAPCVPHAVPMPCLPPPAVDDVVFECKGDGRDWARKILARQAAGHSLSRAQVQFAREALLGGVM